MAKTPEGAVKKMISAYLKTVPGLWYDMPVPSGYGKSTLDYIGCYRGEFFAIEAKAPGKNPTDRQMGIVENIAGANGKTFVIRNELELNIVKEWINSRSEHEH